MQLDACRQRGAQIKHALLNHAAIIGEERRAADAFGKAGQRHAADHQAAIDGFEMPLRRMHGTIGIHVAV